MVSGLVTSPWDQLRIFSGEAREMRIESKSAIKFARSEVEERIGPFYQPFWGRGPGAGGRGMEARFARAFRKRFPEKTASTASTFPWPPAPGPWPPFFSRPPVPYPALHAA